MLNDNQKPMNSPADEPARPTAMPPTATGRAWWWTGAAVLAGAVVLTLLLTARHGPPPSAEPTAAAPSQTPTPPPSQTPGLPDFEVEAASVLEGDANWYDVPENSLPQRRAWPGEFTAASDRVPPNTYARVRRIDAKGDLEKSIVVRITDNGVHRKSTVIDLDRQAAEALDMVKAGQARVRVEVLALKNASTDKPVEKKGSPSAPKTTDLTDQPAASEKQEKDAASAKTGVDPK